MDFPAYVPAAVRTCISTMLEGDSWEPLGWRQSLIIAERELNEIEREIKIKTQRGEVEYLSGLRKQRSEATEHRDSLASDVDFLKRLAHDARMADAYALLTREFTDDDQWRRFTNAAWAARADYSKYRTRLKRAEELKTEIANAAEKLVKLIQQFSETGVNGPNEFYSVPDLLRQTDNYEMTGHNLRMWRSMRHHVLGDRPQSDRPESEPQKESYEIQTIPQIAINYHRSGEKLYCDPLEEGRNILRYAWGTAPGLPSLLGSLSKAARNFKPVESGMIGAAIDSRQRSSKTEYLRAFGNLLTEVHDFVLTTQITKAIAVVATVAINLPDVVVSYDDVRKALK